MLLHGFPQHWYAWRHVMGELAVDHRVVCLDMRGFGWSDAPKRGYDTGTRVADVLAVMDALGVGKARVIAHEFGAWTAFMLCLRAPERVSHLLALNVVHPWPSQRRLLPQAWRYWYTSPLEAPLLGRFVLRHVPGFTRYLLRKGAADPAAIAEFVRAAGERGRARAGEAMHRAYALRDIPGLALGRYRRMRLSTPTRILAGERDFALSPRAVTSADGHADDLTVEVLPGCGHFVHEERPDAGRTGGVRALRHRGRGRADAPPAQPRARTAEAIWSCPETSSRVRPAVAGASRSSSSTAATSSRGTEPRPTCSAASRTRPVPASSVSEPGRRIVQSRVVRAADRVVRRALGPQIRLEDRLAERRLRRPRPSTTRPGSGAPPRVPRRRRAAPPRHGRR